MKILKIRVIEDFGINFEIEEVYELIIKNIK